MIQVNPSHHKHTKQTYSVRIFDMASICEIHNIQQNVRNNVIFFIFTRL